MNNISSKKTSNKFNNWVHIDRFQSDPLANLGESHIDQSDKIRKHPSLAKQSLNTQSQYQMQNPAVALFYIFLNAVIYNLKTLFSCVFSFLPKNTSIIVNTHAFTPSSFINEKSYLLQQTQILETFLVSWASAMRILKSRAIISTTTPMSLGS